MKNICEILKQKEADLARVRYEVESLRIVAPLVSDDLDDQSQTHLMTTDDLLDIARQRDPDSKKASGSVDLVSSIGRALGGFWKQGA